MLSETFENVQNGEIKSESGFRVAMASQPLEEVLMLGWFSDGSAGRRLPPLYHRPPARQTPGNLRCLLWSHPCLP